MQWHWICGHLRSTLEPGMTAAGHARTSPGMSILQACIIIITGAATCSLGPYGIHVESGNLTPEAGTTTMQTVCSPVA